MIGDGDQMARINRRKRSMMSRCSAEAPSYRKRPSLTDQQSVPAQLRQDLGDFLVTRVETPGDLIDVPGPARICTQEQQRFALCHRVDMAKDKVPNIRRD